MMIRMIRLRRALTDLTFRLVRQTSSAEQAFRNYRLTQLKSPLPIRSMSSVATHSSLRKVSTESQFTYLRPCFVSS